GSGALGGEHGAVERAEDDAVAAGERERGGVAVRAGEDRLRRAERLRDALPGRTAVAGVDDDAVAAEGPGVVAVGGGAAAQVEPAGGGAALLRPGRRVRACRVHDDASADGPVLIRLAGD